MLRPRRLRNTLRIGLVEAGGHVNRHDVGKRIAACTDPMCGVYAEYLDRTAAELVTRTDRCQP